MKDESGFNKARRSKDSSFTLDISLSNSAIKPKKKKPCEICGSVTNELLVMTCFKCRETREHTYCARVKLQRVPCLWLCEECRSYSSIPEIAGKTAHSRINQVEEAVRIEAVPSSKTNHLTRTNQAQDPIDQTAPSSRTVQVVNNKALIEIAPSSRTNQVEQVVPVVLHIDHQYTRDESSLESSCPVSPCSLDDKTNLFHF